ncbi:hypothetical protein AAV94_11290 [Lampropedia cohaerens]|uniref:Fe/B12 periplasmic-binding domain-containing protein n=1 Tax=Lampropedia cohaerens TaxID=1610491 RepID=A0A0U1PY19_9BURK|nr:siderophore ABC transporter substrate-binding protein [Lampropedia cohaerens]KKW67410.1 hypothetical protein AAV94_11290 [Lampropedia cohaerens]
MALAAALAAAPASAQPASQVIFETSLGKQVAVPAAPARVVVFDLATLDMLQALGVDAVVGVPAFRMPEHLKAFESDSVAKVGSLFEPDYEAIRALNPQVIFIGRRSQAREAELAKLAPTVDMAIDESHAVDSIFANLRALGRLFDREDRAERLIAEAQAEIEALRAIAPRAGTAMVLLVSGGRINTYGPGSRMGMIFDVFGVQPAMRTGLENVHGRHGQSISFEYILQANPDWLLVLDRDGAIGREGEAARQLLDNALVKATTAGRKGQIVFLDGMNWYALDGAGITALRENVRQLHEVFARSLAAQ